MAELFKRESFKSHGGIVLPWKVECDALGAEEWVWVADRITEKFTFVDVYGVPSGGDTLANILRSRTKPDGDFYLIVDDVLTTGGSMQKARDATRTRHPDVPRVGVVLFARSNPPTWVTSIWRLWD